MPSVLVLWVLVAASTTSGRPMMAQQFQSKDSCEQAAHFLLDVNSPSYTHAICIEDRADAGPAAVLVAASTSPGRPMLGQQWQSRAACEHGAQFLGNVNSPTYLTTRCLVDQPRRAGAPASSSSR